MSDYPHKEHARNYIVNNENAYSLSVAWLWYRIKGVRKLQHVNPGTSQQKSSTSESGTTNQSCRNAFQCVCIIVRLAGTLSIACVFINLWNTVCLQTKFRF